MNTIGHSTVTPDDPVPLAQRRLVLSAAMLGTAVLSDWATPRRLMAQESPMPPLGTLIPLSFSGWEGVDASRSQLVSPDVQAVLDQLYQQTLARVYRHRRYGSVMLALAYGGDQSDATRVHRPEVCYPAQGFTIGPLHPHRLEIGRGPERRVLPVQRLKAQMGSRHEPITYWVAVGQHVATRASEQKWIQMRYGWRGIIPDGLLMRVSSLDRDSEQAWWIHHRYIDALAQTLADPWRPRLFGQAQPLA